MLGDQTDKHLNALSKQTDLEELRLSILCLVIASFLTGLYPFQNGQIGLATHRYAISGLGNTTKQLNETSKQTSLTAKSSKTFSTAAQILLMRQPTDSRGYS